MKIKLFTINHNPGSNPMNQKTERVIATSLAMAKQWEEDHSYGMGKANISLSPLQQWNPGDSIAVDNDQLAMIFNKAGVVAFDDDNQYGMVYPEDFDYDDPKFAYSKSDAEYILARNDPSAAPIDMYDIINRIMCDYK